MCSIGSQTYSHALEPIKFQSPLAKMILSSSLPERLHVCAKPQPPALVYFGLPEGDDFEGVDVCERWTNPLFDWFKALLLKQPAVGFPFKGTGASLLQCC